MSTDTGDNTVTQVRLDIAELKGIVTTSLSDQARRLDKTETVATQLRIDLTAVNDLLNTRIGLQENTTVRNTENISDVRKDISEIYSHINGQWAKIVGVITPIIAIASMILTIYLNTKH